MICFHIIIYSFDNFVYLFYGCMLVKRNQTDDWELIYASLLLCRALEIEVFQIISIEQITSWSTYMIQQVLQLYQASESK